LADRAIDHDSDDHGGGDDHYASARNLTFTEIFDSAKRVQITYTECYSGEKNGASVFIARVRFLV